LKHHLQDALKELKTNTSNEEEKVELQSDQVLAQIKTTNEDDAIFIYVPIPKKCIIHDYSVMFHV
jgi:hypothetical protein